MPGGGGARRVGVLGTFLSAAAVASGYLGAFLPQGPPGWASWVFVLGTAGILTSLMALGAAKGEGLGRGALLLVVLWGILVGGFGAVLLLPEVDPAAPVLWLGLPPRSAVLLYGVGILPILLVPLAYAWTFDELGLAPGEVEQVREEARRAREGGEG